MPSRQRRKRQRQWKKRHHKQRLQQAAADDTSCDPQPPPTPNHHLGDPLRLFTHKIPIRNNVKSPVAFQTMQTLGQQMLHYLPPSIQEVWYADKGDTLLVRILWCDDITLAIEADTPWHIVKSAIDHEFDGTSVIVDVATSLRYHNGGCTLSQSLETMFTLRGYEALLDVFPDDSKVLFQSRDHGIHATCFLTNSRSFDMVITPWTTTCMLREKIQAHVDNDAFECPICCTGTTHLRCCTRCTFSLCMDCENQLYDKYAGDTMVCPGCRFEPTLNFRLNMDLLQYRRSYVFSWNPFSLLLKTYLNLLCSYFDCFLPRSAAKSVGDYLCIADAICDSDIKYMTHFCRFYHDKKKL